ncbi:hypothetical protein I4I84_00715 [Pseudonocardia sp. KRD-182]|uniref:hypothetical protein n=1 Tax=Pseudonocardia oceani TaxID=2792013 RepID=UPI001C4A6053|nr:hypothetical protein [Pseudonocardia oceani]MBW0107274.1 hypothetical protein [Pseudonocardia oceani]
MLPIEATTPEVRRVRPKSIEVYWALDSVVAVVDQPGDRFALVQGHADGVEDEFAA